MWLQMRCKWNKPEFQRRSPVSQCRIAIHRRTLSPPMEKVGSEATEVSERE